MSVPALGILVMLIIVVGLVGNTVNIPYQFRPILIRLTKLVFKSVLKVHGQLIIQLQHLINARLNVLLDSVIISHDGASLSVLMILNHMVILSIQSAFILVQTDIFQIIQRTYVFFNVRAY